MIIIQINEVDIKGVDMQANFCIKEAGVQGVGLRDVGFVW
jgi:hypothetical protein